MYEQDTASDTSSVPGSDHVNEDTNPTQDFADMTLAEGWRAFWRSPVHVFRSTMAIIREAEEPVQVVEDTLSDRTPQSIQIPMASDPTPRSLPQVTLQNPSLAAWKLLLYCVAFLVALLGSHIAIRRSIPTQADVLENSSSVGGWLMIFGVVIWLLAEIIGQSEAVRRWWVNTDQIEKIRTELRLLPIGFFIVGLLYFIHSFGLEAGELSRTVLQGSILLVLAAISWLAIDVVWWWRFRVPSDEPGWQPNWHWSPSIPSPAVLLRIVALLVGILLTLMVWSGTSGNQYSDSTFYAWLGSIAFWVIAFFPRAWNLGEWFRSRRRAIGSLQNQQVMYGILALLVIMGLALVFRVHRLNEVPAEITSDHVEKLLDGQRVLNGDRPIWFANNGGREPFQMYALAALSYLPGQGINHLSLKILAVIESMITIPVLFWMGREIVGERNRNLGILVGLLTAALVAVSYWHLTFTRLALRIVLTPLVSSLLLIYLTRAMRHNRRMDFIKAGLTLGFGLYMYQAVRMLPIVVVVGIAIGFYFGFRRFRDRASFVFNSIVLVVLSLVIFVPLLHYTVEFPDQFNERTFGRIFGEAEAQVLEDGTEVYRDLTLDDRLEAFNENVPILMSNVRNVLLMFHIRGDVGWVTGASNIPVLDTIVGALLVLGIGSWVFYAWRKRDPVFWFLPIAAFIMLMPSALAIARPIENPSFTRTSGALPMIFLLAAFPLGLFIWQLRRVLRREFAIVFSMMVVTLVILISSSQNANLYFNDFDQGYRNSSLPHSEAGNVLRGFAESDGAYGNAFMVGYEHWWDHRAIGLSAGLTDWQNGIIEIETLPAFIQRGLNGSSRHPFFPDRDLLFFVSVLDTETQDQLATWFPEGRGIVVQSYQPEDEYYLFRAPAIGTDNVQAFIEAES